MWLMILVMIISILLGIVKNIKINVEKVDNTGTVTHDNYNKNQTT